MNVGSWLELKKFKEVSTLEKIAITIPLIFQTKELFNFGQEKWLVHKSNKLHTIKIKRDTDLCLYAANWASELTREKIKDFQVDSASSWNDETMDYDYKLLFFFSEKTSFDFYYQDYKFHASFDAKTEGSKAEKPLTSNLLKELTGSYENQGYLYLTAQSAEGLAVLKQALTELDEKSTATKRNNKSRSCGFYNWNKNGWKRSDREKRPISSVILKDNLLDEITDDLENFLKNKNNYFKKGIPWRRGYLFHGPPGTGKSSIIKALASHFNRDMFFLSLNDIQTDGELIDAVSDMRPNGILLIEDVDVFRVSNDRNDGEIETFGVTLSALLNVLDGPASPDGLITFMSTNYRERLDSALVRKGRVDFEAEIGLPDLDQISRLWNVFYEDVDFELSEIDESQPTSYYFDIFKTHLEDPDSARKLIKDGVK